MYEGGQLYEEKTAYVEAKTQAFVRLENNCLPHQELD
jgi:hypothetical protein